MSFADLERGLATNSPLAQRGGASPQGTQATELLFKALTDRISIQIFKIDSNVAGITKVVELLGTNRDTPDIRGRLAALTDATTELVKNSTEDIRSLAKWEITPDNRRQKNEQQKVSRDFQAAVGRFTKTQRASAERQRQYIDRAKAVIGGLGDTPPGSPGSHELETRPQQLLQVDQVPDSELEFQEAMIEEREEEIREIETGIHELNEIFRDLGSIVHEQQSMLDNVESNVNSIATDTEGASVQLTQASDFQRKAGRRMLCLLMIFVIVLAIVLLAVLA